MLVGSLKLGQYRGVVCFQDLDVVFVSITWEERNAGDVRQEEEMGPLYCGMIVQSHLCGGVRNKHQLQSFFFFFCARLKVAEGKFNEQRGNNIHHAASHLTTE